MQTTLKINPMTRHNVEAARYHNQEEHYTALVGDLELIVCEDFECPQEFRSLVNWWNKLAEECGFPVFMNITPDRRKLLEHAVDLGILKYLEQIEVAIKDSSYLLGKNFSGWTVHLEWLINKQNSWIKVIEGIYKKNNKAALIYRSMSAEGPCE